LYAAKYRAHWFTRSRPGLGVSTRPTRCVLRHRPLLSRRKQVHPLMRFPSVSEFVTGSNRLATNLRSRGAPPVEFLSSLRHELCRFAGMTRRRAFHRSPAIRPQRSPRSRRLVPYRTLRVCFAPQPHTGFPFQGFSPSHWRADSRQLHPLMSFAAWPLPLASQRCHGSVRRLQGVRPVQRSVSTDRAVKLCQQSDSLLSFHFLGPIPEHLGDAFAPPPLVTLAVYPSL
jgi:hypothetical protein